MLATDHDLKLVGLANNARPSRRDFLRSLASLLPRLAGAESCPVRRRPGG
jgi:hypothetical protein